MVLEVFQFNGGLTGGYRNLTEFPVRAPPTAPGGLEGETLGALIVSAHHRVAPAASDVRLPPQSPFACEGEWRSNWQHTVDGM
jgi:hypothetical protein